MKYKYIDEKGEHLHQIDGQPLYGTSSVADVLAKPLTWWASGLAVKVFGCPDAKILTKMKNKLATEKEKEGFISSANAMLQKIKLMTVEEYIKLIDSAYRNHQTTLKDKAHEGTDLHAECERFIKDEMAGVFKDKEQYHERIYPLIDWSRTYVKRHLWSEVNCFSKEMWTGGISDWGVELNSCVLSGVDIKDGTICVVDFKSSKEAYLSQFWQACGYAIQIEENGGFDKDGNQTFKFQDHEKVGAVIIIPFGMENPYPQVNIDIDGGKEAFKCELFLYKRLPKN